MTYWRDLIYLYEIHDVQHNRLPTQSPPIPDGIHYSAMSIIDRAQLLRDIECCFDTALHDDRVPAGRIRGLLSAGTIGADYSYADCDRLASFGINPIILPVGRPPCLWGEKFFCDQQCLDIADWRGNLTPAFHAFLAHRHVGQPVAPQAAAVLPIHRALASRPGQFGLYVPGSE